DRASVPARRWRCPRVENAQSSSVCRRHPLGDTRAWRALLSPRLRIEPPSYFREYDGGSTARRGLDEGEGRGLRVDELRGVLHAGDEAVEGLEVALEEAGGAVVRHLTVFG